MHSTDIGERCGDRCSDDENQTSSDDVELDDIIQFQDKPLAVVAQADSLEALAVERGFSDRGEKDAKSLIEDKLIETDEKLGISMGGQKGGFEETYSRDGGRGGKVQDR